MDIYGRAWDFMGGQSFQAQKRKQATDLWLVLERGIKLWIFRLEPLQLGNDAPDDSRFGYLNRERRELRVSGGHFYALWRGIGYGFALTQNMPDAVRHDEYPGWRGLGRREINQDLLARHKIWGHGSILHRKNADMVGRGLRFGLQQMRRHDPRITLIVLRRFGIVQALRRQRTDGICAAHRFCRLFAVIGQSEKRAHGNIFMCLNLPPPAQDFTDRRRIERQMPR